PPRSPVFPYTTLFRSRADRPLVSGHAVPAACEGAAYVGGTKPPGGGTRDPSGDPCRNREACANKAAARGQCRLVSRARDRLSKNPLQQRSWTQFARSGEAEPFGGSSRLASV